MAAFALLIPISTVEARDLWSGWKPFEARYIHKYERAHRAGHYLGSNIVDDGSPSRAHVLEDSAQITALMHPPPAPEPVAVESTEAPVTAEPAPVSTGGTPPEYIAQCESGGSYSAVNSSSGAYGKWQILPSTSASYGCDMSTPAGQDACAAEIYSDVGSSAWVCG